MFVDAVADTASFACRPISGGGGLGQPPDADGLCKWRVVSGTAPNQICTKPCDFDEDCGGTLPFCKSSTVKLPSGGISVIKVCKAGLASPAITASERAAFVAQSPGADEAHRCCRLHPLPRASERRARRWPRK